MSLKTKVTLMTKTEFPVETVYCQWFQSRKTTDQKVPMPAEVRNMLNAEKGARYGKGLDGVGPYEKEVMDVFNEVISMKMPLGETLDFVFLIENLPVALREQLVRHRIGHKFGDQTGADILVSEVANNSTFWSQTTRIVDMGSFATNGEYLTPQWLEEHGDRFMDFDRAPRKGAGTKSEYEPDPSDPKPKTIAEFYREQMLWIQAAYRRLVKAGMPLEDARNILPVAMMHRMTWKTNLSSLMHVLSRRGCWLAQLGMWEPVIRDIVEELATKVHPSLRRMIDPPCFNQQGNYETCAFKRENEEIVTKGEYPPCSLWINKDQMSSRTTDIAPDGGGVYRCRKCGRATPFHNDGCPNVTINTTQFEHDVVSEARMPRYNRMQERYASLWGRDPRTGERKQLV